MEDKKGEVTGKSYFSLDLGTSRVVSIKVLFLFCDDRKLKLFSMGCDVS